MIGLVDRQRQTLEALVDGHAARHGLKPQPEARRDRRRAAVAPRAGQQNARRAQRAHEIMGRKTGAVVETGKPQGASDFRSQPWFGRRGRGPDAFVHATQNHQVGLFAAGIEQLLGLDHGGAGNLKL